MTEFQIVLGRLVATTEELAYERANNARDRAQYETRHIPAGADPALLHELMCGISDKNKIVAIKAFRSITGWGLKESKDAVERVI